MRTKQIDKNREKDFLMWEKRRARWNAWKAEQAKKKAAEIEELLLNQAEEERKGL